LRPINGYENKRVFVSPSLFGLEYYEENSTSERIHGYTAGIYHIDSGKISKTIWPRISLKISSGIKISQNEEFNLDKDSSSMFEMLKQSESDEASDNTEKEFIDIEKKNKNLFSEKTITDRGLARTLYKEVNSHKGIRFQERKLATEKLNTQKLCWIVTRFGLGEDEFIGSILSDTNINVGNCFCINCDEVSNIEDLTNVFNTTFFHKITEFFDVINTLDNPLLVFDNLNENLCNDSANLKEFVQTIFDFSTELKIVIVSNNIPDSRIFNYIELTELDIPAVKQYIEKSNDLQSSFTFIEYEKIHRISSGIPLYIDKIIEQLSFRPLTDLGDMEFDSSSGEDTNMILPKTIQSEVKRLRLDDSKQSDRRFKLLSVISLLHNGETYERLRKYSPSSPFHVDDVSFLLKNKLIETIQVNSIFEQKQNDNELIKIIKAPREIRDFMNTLLSDDDKLEIYKNICNLYLGSNWRNSIKLIQSKDAELNLIIHQNLQFAIRFILLNGIENENELETTRMTRVSMSLIEYFSDKGAYKDAVSLSEETLLLTKDVSFDDILTTRVYLMKSLGENLRMTSIHEKSIDILKSICDDEENSLSRNERNNIRLSIAYAYETQDNKENAISYANLINDNEKNKNSYLYLAAESVIAHFIDENDTRIRKLNTLKNKANKFGYTTLKANIILEISSIKRTIKQVPHLDKVIKDPKISTYNKIRTLALKSDIILKTKNIHEITNEDLFGLHISYSYSFYQRLLSLLNNCHRLAWKYWLEQHRFDQLLNLFRYSSFVWRLCGDTNLEQRYIDELHSNEEFKKWFGDNKNSINSIYYEQRVFALYRYNITKSINLE
jgi:hypothetical protein